MVTKMYGMGNERCTKLRSYFYQGIFMNAFFNQIDTYVSTYICIDTHTCIRRQNFYALSQV